MTSMIRDRFGRRSLAAAILVGLIGLFAFDLFVVEPADSAEFTLPGDSGLRRADVTFKKVRYDAATRAVVADLDVKVFSKTDLVFKHLAIAIRTTGQDRSLRVPFLQTATDECALTAGFDYPTDAQAFRSSGSYLCRDVEIASPVQSAEILYPFDTYAVPLSFRTCVNTLEACDGSSELPVRVERIRIEPERTQHLIASMNPAGEQAVALTLRRRIFLQIVTVVFFVIVLAFVGYLVFAADPRDTMTKSLGVFAAIWGLRSIIVPASIAVFPTIVEGMMMAMFCIVFALVLVRAIDNKEVQP